jgi:hypothetical protein
MPKIGGFSSENYLKTLVIKVSKTSFSKLRVRKNSYPKPSLFFSLHHKCDEHDELG